MNTIKALFASATTGTTAVTGDIHDTPGDHSGGHGSGASAQITLFLFGGLLLGGLSREINKKTGIPYTPMIFILGIVGGFFNENLGYFGQALDTVSDIDPHGLLLIFLPLLIFESGFNADWHIFKKQFVQILTLAVPCVFVSAIFVAFAIKVVLGYSDEYYSWLTAFMFGAILSCTDTVAVLALLKEVGASKKFNSLIEGESLINDGTCMVLLTIASEIAKGKSLSPAEITQLFCELTLGGTVLGIVFGIISVIWIRKIFNDEILVVNITLIACYMVYYVAENVNLGIKISGIIALVSLGLFMAAFGRTRINTESEHAVHTFWKYAVYCGETIIFLVAGIIIGVKILLNPREDGALPITQDDLIKLGYLYLCMMVARFMSIAVFMPILKRYGYGLQWKEVFVLTYGGLRGAIGISFALIVARDTTYEATLRHFILFDMAGCAFLTLVINGTTAGYFVKKAGLAGSSPIKQRVFLGYLQQFLEEVKKWQEELKNEPYLASVDWKRVDDMVGVQKLERLVKDEAARLAERDKVFKEPSIKKKAERRSSKTEKKNENDLNEELVPKDHKQSVSDRWEEESFAEDDSDAKLVIECRNRFLMALKGEYFHLHAYSQCSPDAFILLKESADWDLDKEAYPMSSWDHISHTFMNPTYIRFLFFMKTIPVFGRYAKNALFNHLSFVYDVTLNYITAHEAVEELVQNLPFDQDVKNVILKECEENKGMAENYINNYLNVSFPEINKSIQMKKAAFNILNREKEHLEESLEQGQLDDKEYKTLKKIVDNYTYRLGESNEPWDVPPVNEFLKKLIFFSQFTEDEIKEIMADAKEKPFHKDEFICKEGLPAEHLYVITRGIATESCKQSNAHFKEKKGVGSVISYHQIVSNQQRYATSVVCDSVVYALRLNLATVRKIIRKHKSIEEFLWRESFYFMTRFQSKELSVFESIDRNILSQILTNLTFKKYKPEQEIDVSRGGIFLKGQAVLKRTTGDEEAEEKKLTNLAYIPYNTAGFNTKITMVAEKTCWAFHFTNPEKILELISLSAMDKEKSRSLSFTGSFRRTSGKAKPKIKEIEREHSSPAHVHGGSTKKSLDVIHDDDDENN